MKKLLKYPLIIILISFGFSSCSCEREYTIVVKNKTDYRLNKVAFSCYNDGIEVSAEPRGNSEPVKITYKKGFGHFFTQPLLCVTVSSYSDSLTLYENKTGYTVAESRLKEGPINNIVVDSDSNQAGNDIFSIKLE